jgi:type VI secretion system protein ImpL
MKDTHAYLEMLFAQPFMGAPPVTLAYSVGWDYARLHGAGDTAKAYAAFAAVTGDHTPPALRAVALEIARDHVTAQLDQAVDQATPSAPGRSYIPDSEATAFIQALPMLLATRNILAEVGAGRAAALLDARVGERASQLLFIADAQLNADRGPYAVDIASLAAWNGTGSLAAAAFGVDTLDDLVGTLPQRRGVVATIARGRVAPLLAYLHDPGTAPANVALVRKWQGIVDTLQAYDAGSPNNSLTRLERFMTVDIDRLQQDCARIRGSRATMGDYFAAQQAAIAARVGRSCGAFARTDARSQFEKLRQAFNSTLANRFPFGGDRAPPADPGAVQSFFVTYGDALGPLRAQIEAQQPGSGAAAVLGQLQRVQAALAPMLSGPGPLSYKVDVAFLTDPALAQGQQQIVEARLGASPADEAKMPHGPPSFTWTMGQSVTLTLRWALNAPSLPTEGITDDAGRCLPPPGGGGARVRVSETWALLRLIARHRAEAAGDPDDGAEGGIPLAFTIPVCANLQRASGGDDRPGPARVLVRVSLSALIRTPDKPDRLVPVTLPVFPRSIPPLDGWPSER